MKVWHLAVVAAVVVAIGYRVSERHVVGVYDQENQESTAQSVVVVPVKRTDFKALWESVGSVMAKSSMPVTSGVDGVVGQIRFKEGDMVTAGQTLLVLDGAPYQNKITEMTASISKDTALVTKAENDVEHAAILLKKQLISQNDMTSFQTALQSAQTLLQQDQTSLKQAEQSLAGLEIKAPIAGRMGPRLISAGMLIHAGSTELTSISQLDPIMVQFTLPKKYLSHIQTDLKQNTIDVTAEFNNDARVEQRHGIVSAVSDAASDKQGNLTLKADFANPQHDWQPGQFVKVQLAPETLNNVLVIPSQALQQGSHGLQLFIVDNEHAKRVEVQEIAANSGYSAITGPVQAGDLVIVEGQYHVADNTPVTVALRDPAHRGGSGVAQTVSASNSGVTAGANAKN